MTFDLTCQVMRLLSLLCVSQGVAMREKQRQVYKHLIGCRDLLLQTSLKDRVYRYKYHVINTIALRCVIDIWLGKNM